MSNTDTITFAVEIIGAVIIAYICGLSHGWDRGWFAALAEVGRLEQENLERIRKRTGSNTENHD